MIKSKVQVRLSVYVSYHAWKFDIIPLATADVFVQRDF